MIPLQQNYLDPEVYVPPIIDAIATVVLFVVVFAIIYLLGKYFVSRPFGPASNVVASRRLSSASP